MAMWARRRIQRYLEENCAFVSQSASKSHDAKIKYVQDS